MINVKGIQDIAPREEDKKVKKMSIFADSEYIKIQRPIFKVLINIFINKTLILSYIIHILSL
jgi:hypothetical protein